MFKSAQAKKRHDHLFAMLGIAGDARDQALVIDYDISVVDLVERVAKTFLRQKGSLEVLYRARPRTHLILAPSWVSASS